MSAPSQTFSFENALLVLLYVYMSDKESTPMAEVIFLIELYEVDNIM